MKYFVKTGDGTELTIVAGTQMVLLFRQGFLDADDQIRLDGSERWRRIGSIPEYAALIRDEKQDRRRFKTVFLVTLFAVIAFIAFATWWRATQPAPPREQPRIIGVGD